METSQDNILITLNSKYGTKLNDTYLSDVIFPFSGILKPSDNIKKAFISLQNATIPVSFYIINDTNKQIVLKNLVGTSFYIDLTVGNYSASTLIIELQTQINLSFTNTCSIIFNKNNGKFTFTFSAYSQIMNTSTMNEILGTGGNTLTTDISFKIRGPYRIKYCIKSFFVIRIN